MTSLSRTRAALLAERDEAILLLRAGADATHVIEPAAARDPIRWLLLAAAEQCAMDWHILGKPVTYQLALARALIERRGRD